MKTGTGFTNMITDRKDLNPFGQGLVEHSIILSLVAVALMVFLLLLGSGVKDVFCTTLIGMNPDYSTSCIEALEEVEVDEGQPHTTQAIAVNAASRGSIIVAARIPEDLIAGLHVED